MLLKPEGNGKLSKRDGDRLGFPVFPLRWTDPKSGEISSGYRESGYIPESFINMLALLGWNPGTEQEIFSMDELIEAFSIERIGKSGSKFDPEKAKWFNHHYLNEKDNAFLASYLQPVLKEKGIITTDAYLTDVCGLIKERCTLLPDLWEQSSYFFKAPESYDEKFIKKQWKENTSDILVRFKDFLSNIEPFSMENLDKTIHQYIEDNGLNMGQVMNPWRLTLVGAGKGPGMTEIAALLGKKEVIARMDKALKVLE